LISRGLIATILLVLLASLVRAQESPDDAQARAPLRVGVVERPPFAIRTDDGAWFGIGVDLWRLAAEDLGLAYAYVDVAPGLGLDALTSGEIDVLLPVDATPELEAAADATHPFYTATMGVASKRQVRLLSVVEGFFTVQLLRLVLGLSVLLLAVGALVWLLERRRNEEQFNRGILRGLGDGFWWAGVTLTTIGYGDKAPVTLAGRTVAMLWMLVGLAVSAALTAAIVTMASVSEQVDVPEVFRDRSVATVEGSTAKIFLDREQVPSRTYASLLEALRGLDAGEVALVAAAAPDLLAIINGNGTLDIGVRSTPLDPHYVSFALPQGSPLRDPLNVLLLQRLTSESGWNLIDRYLPEQGG
jgi:ABC-type amino acid transport substrate-binding protein